MTDPNDHTEHARLTSSKSPKSGIEDKGAKNLISQDGEIPKGNLLAEKNSVDGDGRDLKAISAQAAPGEASIIGQNDNSLSSSSTISSNTGNSTIILGCSVAGLLLIVLTVSLLVAKKVHRSGYHDDGGGGGGQSFKGPPPLSRKSDVFKAEPTQQETTSEAAPSKGHFKNSKSLVDVELGLQLQQQQQEEEAKLTELSKSQTVLETLTNYVWPTASIPIAPPPSIPPPALPTTTTTDGDGDPEAPQSATVKRESMELPLPDSRLLFNTSVNRDSLGSIMEAPMNYEVRVCTERPKHDLRVMNRLSGGDED